MLKETDTDETKSIFCDIVIIGSNSIGGAQAPWPPSPGYAYGL